MATAKTQETPEVTVVEPVLPGYLTIVQIAKLAGVKPMTMRGYHATGAAGIPAPASRTGATPLWSVADVIEWLEARPFAPTKVTQRSDGSIVVEARPGKS